MDRMKKAIDRVKEALEQLKVHGHVRIEEIAPRDTSRVTVYVNDEYFGVYDIDRRTFVD